MKIKSYSDKSIFFRLYRTTRNLEENLSKKLLPFNINITEALCLVFLFVENDNDIFLKDISNSLGFKKSLVSHSISSLETKKYVSRKINELDKRRYKFKLSSHGKKIIPSIFELFDDIENSIESKLSKEDCNTLDLIFNSLDNS